MDKENLKEVSEEEINRVKEISKEKGLYSESMDNSLDMKVKEVISDIHPEEKSFIKSAYKEVTFKELIDGMKQGKSVSEITNIYDTETIYKVLRELAKRLNIEYDDLYDMYYNYDGRSLKELDESKEEDQIHEYVITYNDGAIQRTQTKNKKVTIKGTRKDIMEWMENHYVDGKSLCRLSL